MLRVDDRTFSTALVREALACWTRSLLPSVEASAQKKWGAGWQTECSEHISKPMKAQIAEGKEWDVYRVASAFMENPDVFFPDYDRLTDSAKEQFR